MGNALVAKSYIGLEQLTEPYELNGKMYVKVRMKNGQAKQVRAYSEKEYARYNPEVKIIQPAKSRRDVLGFGEAGFIWIFKGETYENLEWFKASPARYNRVWGWYLPSAETMMDPLPANIEPLKLYWNDVSENDQLKDENILKKIADSLLYDAGTSEYVGEVGERLDLILTCTRAIAVNNMYGTSIFHTFEDSCGNVFTWATSARSLEPGITYAVKGSVKEHTTYKNVRQTSLTRCKCEEI